MVTAGLLLFSGDKVPCSHDGPRTWDKMTGPEGKHLFDWQKLIITDVFNNDDAATTNFVNLIEAGTQIVFDSD